MSVNRIAVSGRRLSPAVGLLLGIATLGSVYGCGDKATNPTNPVPLTLAARGIGGASHHLAPSTLGVSSAAPAVAADVRVTYATALLVVRDVRFVLSESSTDDGSGATDSMGMGEPAGAFDDDAGQIRFDGPFVIDLLSGQAERLGTQMVMPGDYRRVQGHLRSLRSGDEDASTHAGLVDYTVLLEGTIGGEGGGDFSYRARIDNEFQIRGSFAVEAETPATAFVAFDLSRWLTDGGGWFLDPRDAENDQAIKSAIRHSIKVGMDDDHDGEMDDQEMSGEAGA